MMGAGMAGRSVALLNGSSLCHSGLMKMVYYSWLIWSMEYAKAFICCQVLII
jgi:hypothetical protein